MGGVFPEKHIFTKDMVHSIHYGRMHAILVEKYGKAIYSWGLNGSGELGLGNDMNYATPQKIMFNFGSKIASVSCGSYHTMAVTESGEIYGWGFNDDGRLGLGDAMNRNLPTKLPIENIKSVSCGAFHTIIVMRNGCGYSCGSNLQGQLGLGSCSSYQKSLCRLNLSDIVSTSCGWNYTMALTLNGVYSWGVNTNGQLGLGDFCDRHTPHQIKLKNKLLEDSITLRIISVICGLDHSMALTSKGELFACGSNNYGQLGLGHVVYSLNFQKINFNEFIMSVNCGDYHTIITTKSGKFHGWGHNYNGQLGLKDTDNRSEPTEIVVRK